MSRIAILIVAAGKGERAGRAKPKQYELLGGQPMLRRTVEAFTGWPVRVVIGPGQEALYQTTMGPKAPAPVTGGTRRQDSVRLGLQALAADPPDFVLIHDAARPLISHAAIERVIAALEAGAAGAVPMLAVADTLRRKEGAIWVTVARDGLQRAQTPQGFRFADILGAHRDHANADATDDVAIAEMAGLVVEAVPGEESNLKVTTEKDFALAERLLDSPAGRFAAATRDETRSAMGYDAHRFIAGDHVWLCGVKVPHDHGLEGHSDADAGLHALTDALLGCICAGDIGQHFPPTDERWKGAPSWKFLDHANALVREKGGAVLHCDITLICERPKIGPYRDAMRARIAEILSLKIDHVSVKATTTEGMGYTGRREGLAAQAIATVRLPSGRDAVWQNKTMRLSTIIASVFGIGYFPVASGTVMSAVAVPLAMILARHGGGIVLVAASLIAFAIGVWACGAHVRATGREDPSECVIDELAGQWLACAGICFSANYPSVTEFALTFLLFRLFDILKPWPISAAERLPGGMGVMADDMLAGLAAAIIAAIVQYFRVI